MTPIWKGGARLKDLSLILAKMKVTITSEDSNGLQRRVGWFFQNNSSSLSRTPAPVLNLQEMYGDLDFK